MTLEEENELRYLDTLIGHNTSHAFEKAGVREIGRKEFGEIHDRFHASRYLEYKTIEPQQPEENIIGKQKAIHLSPSGINYHSFLKEKRKKERLIKTTNKASFANVIAAIIFGIIVTVIQVKSCNRDKLRDRQEDDKLNLENKKLQQQSQHDSLLRILILRVPPKIDTPKE